MLRRFPPLTVVLPALFGALAILCARAAADEPYGRFQFDESDREHWSFVPPVRPASPAVKNAAWVKNPIDAFALARLEEEKIEPNPPADRLTLLRRVYLDLIGLLPTPAEQDAFLADESPEALLRVVDDLLARPEYGERWGRHWLDVVRYAESNGYERDGAKPSALRYRDYVIGALNADKPFDRFLAEQLAGDELPDANAETCIATTFLRLGPWDDEPADPLVDRYDQLDDVLGTTAATFMALSLRCARCHDHKFEQFTQRDYTRMLAIFEPLKRPQEGRTDLDRMVGTAAELSAYQAATKAVDERIVSLSAERDRAEWELSKRLASAGMLRSPEIHPIAATSREQPQTWRYTEEKPPEGWEQPNFDARRWQQGPGGFGAEGTPGAVVRTPWKSKDIWLRREFETSAEALAAVDRARLRFLVHHDDACEVYINGVLATMVAGFTVDYKVQPIYADGIAALVPGKNVMAVHCSQTTGGQYIDVGLVTVEAAPTATGGADIDALVLPADAAEAFLADPAGRNAKQQEMVKKFRPKLKQLLNRCGNDDEKQSFGELRAPVGRGGQNAASATAERLHLVRGIGAGRAIASMAAGQSARLGRRGQRRLPGHPRRGSASGSHADRQKHRSTRPTGRLADERKSSAHRARHCESHLAASFRRWAGRNGK